MRGSNPYETQRRLDEYLLLHYGKPRELCGFNFVPRKWLQFHERLRTECLSHVNGRVRALDIGCAVGRFTFELARIADQVIGIDNSRTFVQAARRMARTRFLTVQIPRSGAGRSNQRLTVPCRSDDGTVRFEVGDAMDLERSCEGTFEIVAAINLLCRLPSPKRFLQQLPETVASGGQLIMATPWSWLEQYTPRREWLNEAQVERLLKPAFRVRQRRDLPFLIREHCRKYQFVISQVTTFVRR